MNTSINPITSSNSYDNSMPSVLFDDAPEHPLYKFISHGVSFSTANFYTQLENELMNLVSEKEVFHLKNGEKSFFPKEKELSRIQSSVDDLKVSMGGLKDDYAKIDIQEIIDFNLKEEFLETYHDVMTPKEVYREVFPEGTFERRGCFDDKKGNGIVMARCIFTNKETGERYARHNAFMVFDELEEIDRFENAEFAVMTPISYVGRSRKNVNARYVHALVFDIDGVSPDKLKQMLYFIKIGIIPKPTILVNSGHGVHLYYCLVHPIAAWEKNLTELTKFKHALTDVIWNDYTSDDPRVHHQSCTQSFRMPGSLTKFSNGICSTAYRIGDKITLHELMAFLKAQAEIIEFFHLEPYLQREEKEGIKPVFIDGEMKTKFDYNSKTEKIKRIRSKYDLTDKDTRNTSMLEAKQKWPEWHEKRIVKKEGKGRWTTHKGLYEWWLNRILNEAQVGARYHCLAALAAYAQKSGIPREKLEADAWNVFERFKYLSGSSDKPFKRREVLDALLMYDESFVRYSRNAISKNCKIKIEEQKRNWKKQKDHLEDARNARIKKKERAIRDGYYVFSRREEEIKNYIELNPGLSISEYARKLSASRNTISKYIGNKSTMAPESKAEEIEKFFKENPGLTPTQYAKALGVSRPTIYKYLKREA